MLTAVVVVTILVLESCSALDNMGKCTKDPDKDSKFDFTQFAGENNGKWCIVKGLKTKFTSDVKSISYLITMKKNNVYNLKMNYLRKNSTAPLPFTDEEMTYSGAGVAHSSGISLADTAIDYRYVLAYSELKQNEVDDINKIDQKYGFKGELIAIGNGNC